MHILLTLSLIFTNYEVEIAELRTRIEVYSTSNGWCFTILFVFLINLGILYIFFHNSL